MTEHKEKDTGKSTGVDITSWALGNRNLVKFFVACLLVGGVFAYLTLPKLEDPAIKVKQAMVVVTYPGASAHEVELEVADPLEKAILQMASVDNVQSQSMADMTLLTVELLTTVGEDEVEQEWDMLRRKVASVALPSGASQPIVQDDFGDVFGMFYALVAEGLSDREMSDYAERVKRAVSDIEGVARVDLYGKREECIYIDMRLDQLGNLGVMPTEVLSTLQGQNATTYAGYFNNGTKRVRVRVTDKFSSVSDIENMLLQGHDDEQLRIKDVADVHKGYADPTRNEMFYDGERAIGISIAGDPDYDIVQVGAQVEETLEQLQQTMPAGVRFEKIFNQPERVEDALYTFLRNLLESVAIVILVLIFAMGFKSGVIIGMSLVTIVFGSVFALVAFDGTLQRVSLASFILAMGMLVDNAIVIVDGILVDLKQGLPRRTALTRIGRKTAMPLLGATLIAILAFWPIFLSPDTAGVYCRDLFIVISVSLLLSWVLALVHVPMMADKMLHPQTAAEGEQLYDGKAYRVLEKCLRWGLRWPWLTVAGMVALLLLSCLCYPQLKQSFFPDMVYNQLYMEYKLPEGTNSTQVASDLEQIRNYLMTREEVTHVTTSVGGTPSRYNLVRSVATPTLSYGELIVDFSSEKALTRNIADIQDDISRQFPDAYVKFKRYNLMFKKYPIEVCFNGPDPAVLHQLTDSALAIMRNSDAVYLCRSDWEPQVPVLAIDYDQSSARRTGLSRSDVATSVMAYSGGIPIATFYDGIHTEDIYLKCTNTDGQDIDNLEEVTLFGMMPNLNALLDRQTLAQLMAGSMTKDEVVAKLTQTTPLRQVAQGVDIEWEEPVVMRYNGTRQMRAQCSPVPSMSTEDARQQILADIEAIPLPEGYTLTWEGERKASTQSLKYLFNNVPLAIIIMVCILIMLFKDFKKPIILFLCIPLIVIGVFPAVLISGKEFGMVAIVGMLGLIGMMLKNGIVLMDEIVLQTSQTDDQHEALIRSAKSRLRPVMMASLTTILGMIPLVADDMFGSMAVAIMGGLLVNTVLSLVVIPILYSLFFRKNSRKKPAPNAALLLPLLLLAPATAQAQTLTIDEARSQALAHNKDIAKAEAQRTMADYERKAAKSYFFPRIDLSAGGILSTADGDLSFMGVQIDYNLHELFTAGLSLQQPLYMGGKITASYRMASLYNDMARQQQALTEQEVIVKTDEAFTNVVRAEEMVDVAKAYQTLLNELERQVDAAVRHGMSVRNDLLKVQVKANEAELSRTQADNAVTLARMSLCHILGLPLDSLLQVSHQIDIPEMMLTQGQAIYQRPEAILMDQQSQIADWQVKAQRSDYLPQLALMGSLNYTYGGELAGKRLIDKTGASVGLTLSMPLLTSGERTAKIRSAKAQRLLATIDEADVDEQLRLEFAQAANQLSEAQLEVDIAQRSLNQAEENMRLTRKQYDVGLETLSELLDAQALWQEQAANLVNARCQLFLANTQFLKAAGLLDTALPSSEQQ